MEVGHLHFGAGALGLGLIVPTFLDRVVRSVVCNRDSSSGAQRLNSIAAQKGYEIDVFSDLGVSTQLINGVDAISYADLSGGIEKFFSQVDVILLTTALKLNGLEDSMDELAAVSSALHKKGMSVIILAAENQVDSKWLACEIFKKTGELENFFFIKCVVDRICNKPLIRNEVDGNAVLSVLVENFSAIYLDRTDVQKLPKALSDFICSRDLGCIQVADDFDYIVNRKKWVVNSSHLLLALYAHWNRYPTINNFAEDYPAIVDQLIDDVMRLSKISLEKSPASTAHENMAFSRMLKNRLGRFPQVPYDAVTRFSGPNAVFDFLRDYHRKVVEPHILSFSNGSKNRHLPMMPFHITMCMIDLVSKERWIVRSV